MDANINCWFQEAHMVGVNSTYGYPGFDEISVVIFIYGDPGDDSQHHLWRET